MKMTAAANHGSHFFIVYFVLALVSPGNVHTALNTLYHKFVASLLQTVPVAQKSDNLFYNSCHPKLALPAIPAVDPAAIALVQLAKMCCSHSSKCPSFAALQNHIP